MLTNKPTSHSADLLETQVIDWKHVKKRVIDWEYVGGDTVFWNQDDLCEDPDKCNDKMKLLRCFKEKWEVPSEARLQDGFRRENHDLVQGNGKTTTDIDFQVSLQKVILIKIKVKKLAGATIPVTLSELDTVRHLMLLIERVEGIPTHQQRLSCELGNLDDGDCIIRDCGIQNGSTVSLSLELL